MQKIKQLKYYIIVALLFLIIIGLEISKPKPLNWFESYIANDKIPFGTYILRQTLPEIFSGTEINETYFPVYNTLKTDTNFTGNYIFINRNVYFDKFDLRYLFPMVEKGGNAFICSEWLDYTLEDTFNLAVRFYPPDKNDNIDLLGINPDTLSYNFTQPPFKRNTDFYFRKAYLYPHFTSYDSAHTEVLGVNSFGKPNFIRIKHGKGYFYINLLPKMFTNYQLTDSLHYDYAYRALSYLPQTPVIWDEHYKAGKQIIRSPLRFILQNQPLRYAYYLLLLLTVLFFIFNAKRKQRIIPVVEPPKNATMEFIDIMGNLYFNNEDEFATAQKKLYFWINYIRTQYRIKFSDNNDTIEQIARKSGVNADIIRKITMFKKKNTVTPAELMELHRLLMTFYQTKKR